MTPQSTRTSRRPQLADGSSSGKNFYAACVRALDGWMKLAKTAELVLTELENTTVPGVKHSVSADDSLIIALMDFPDD